MILRICLFVALVYFAVSLPDYLFGIAAFLYILLFDEGYELIILGALIDTVFGATVPVYTVCMLVLVVGGEYLRPLLRWNT